MGSCWQNVWHTHLYLRTYSNAPNKCPRSNDKKNYTITLRAKNHQGLLALKLIENKNEMIHIGMPACSLVEWISLFKLELRKFK